MVCVVNARIVGFCRSSVPLHEPSYSREQKSGGSIHCTAFRTFHQKLQAPNPKILAQPSSVPVMIFVFVIMLDCRFTYLHEEDKIIQESRTFECGTNW
jgi:hypothetical protein